MKHHEIICKSEYVTMRDNIQLAISTWLPERYIKITEKFPAILITTRYWRALELQNNGVELQLFYSLAYFFWSRNYILVVADARGTGASFGSRDAEISQTEVEDIGELVNWTAGQRWCNGNVATTGTSYTANTTLYSLVTASPALKLGVCRAPDLDIYRHLIAPGGLVNHWFIEAWGNHTSALDNNNLDSLLDSGWQPPGGGSKSNVLGVRPVDKDTHRDSLAAALIEHKSNFNLSGMSENVTYIDDDLFTKSRPIYDAHYKRAIERSGTPVVIRCGWHDAGTQLGALAMFASFSNPLRIILGPWSHNGTYRADPFQAGDGTTPENIPKDYIHSLTADSLDIILKHNHTKEYGCSVNEYFRLIEYYTLGENRWKQTREWPLPQTRFQRLYLEAEQRLSANTPISQHGCDYYKVDPSTGTGKNNRWHTQMGNPIFFTDRQEEDNKLLVYDTPLLEHDTEITGHPIVCLWVRSTATDGQFIVYLETVDADGRVRMLTEGQLRALHRKTSNEKPPYKMFGPFHTFKKKDAQLINPGEIIMITFDLFPISVLIKQGQRIRLAIAGADKDVFSPIDGCKTPEITLERNSIHASYIDLPIIVDSISQ